MLKEKINPRNNDMESENQSTSSWLDRPLTSFIPRINIEILLATIILVLAIFSRFYNVDLRVMSHDETNHVVPSFDLFMGRGYRHDPVTHGPLQFHMIALSYFLFGDNDLTSRLPAVIFSIVTIGAVLLLFRRYLGRTGALIAGFLFLISPYMLFYGRYTRNEAFVALWGVLTIFAVFRYLDKGKVSSLYLLAAVTALNFTTKETVYIYVAQLLLFLAILVLEGVARAKSHNPAARRLFVSSTVIALILLFAALGTAAYGSDTAPKVASQVEGQPAVVQPANGPLGNMLLWERLVILGGVGGALIAGVFAAFNLVRAIGWKGIREQRSFDLLILVGSLILPALAAFPVKMVGWDPLDYSTTGMLRTGIFVAALGLVSIAIGLWWRPRAWLLSAAIFYVIFTVFYTTFFTNGWGFWTGLIGSLGYWLAQQGVQRGSQPLYYYALIQIPIYEFLAALGTLLAIYYGIRYRLFSTIPGYSPAHQPEETVPVTAIEDWQEEKEEVVPDGLVEFSEEASESSPDTPGLTRLPVLSMLIFWSLTALVAYSVAGEKMPWLTVHIALPLLLAAGWGLGYLVDSTPWKRIVNQRGIIALLLAPVFLTSLASVFGALFGANPPFQGNTLAQLESTNNFVISLILFVASGAGVLWLLKDWRAWDIVRMVTVVFFAILAVLTIRTAYRASYVNYDTAMEYLVYAHAARGPKDILAQVEEISRRITGGKDIVVAYDNDALYPYWWYFRDYPNKLWYTDNPTRDLLNAPLIIASESNYSKVDSIVKDGYVYTEYMRLWWPNQDYFNLTWERVRYAITNPQLRAAIFDIWLNRDYSAYAKVTNNANLQLNTWQPSSRFRLYIRKDIVGKIWNYGAVPSLPTTTQKDPYAGKIAQIQPEVTFGAPGTDPGQFQKPRGIATAPDGTIYVADASNNRIQHLTVDGKALQTWGTFADVSKGDAPGGTFNEPWGIAVGPDGSVFVSDTWNHRVEKFSADGKFLKMWGYFGQAEKPEAFWGPRGVAVDSKGRLFVTDTGNKRIVIFDSEGNFISQFGSAGIDPGQFDEPVGVALDQKGDVYVTDTWNQRVQVFQPDASGKNYTPLRNWEVSGWFGQSLDNKPFIAVDQNTGNVFVTDPEGYRVLEFDPNGAFVRGWGDYSTGPDGFGLAAGVAVDAQGKVWVTDAANMRVLRFTMPNP
jgi:uncharacterized protein (TIGR03663 family)